MAAELLQAIVFLVTMAGALLFARALARAAARSQRADSAGRTASPAMPGHPVGPLVVVEQVARTHVPGPAEVEVRERAVAGERRIGLAEAREGIVLSAILGPCRGHSPVREDEA